MQQKRPEALLKDLSFNVAFNMYCISHIITGSFMDRGNKYILLVKVLHSKLLTISKKLPNFPHMGLGFESPTTEVGDYIVSEILIRNWKLLTLINHGTKALLYTNKNISPPIRVT